MASFDYSGLASTAQDLIARFGTSAELLVRVPFHNTEWGPKTVDGDPVPVQAVLLGYSDIERANMAIEMGEMKALISAVGLEIEPNTGHRLRAGGEEWGIVAVERVAPAGDAIIYKLRVKK